MWESIFVGAGLAFAAAAQPGPLQAFLLSRVAALGWRRTLPAALAPVISDGPIALVVVAVLRQAARGFESLLRGAGGVVLLYFAARTLREWREARLGTGAEGPSAPRTLLQAVAVNFVNPGPWVGWSLILGPLALEAWAEAPAEAVTLVAAFYVVMVVTLGVFIVLLGTTSSLGPRGRRRLLLASSLVLAGLGVYSLLSVLI